MGASSKDKRDIYYRKAKEEGWRARSAYKLLQLDERFGFLEGCKAVLDLCAAPGAWSQVLSRKLYKRSHQGEEPALVAVDLQPMAPVEGVTQVQGDITSAETLSQVVSLLPDGHSDAVLSDGAPDVTGLHDMDEYIQSQLLLSAISASCRCLKPGGTFVAKIFRGRDVSLLYAQLKALFPTVHCAKPKASRNASVEAFAVCLGFSPTPGMDPARLAKLLEEKALAYADGDPSSVETGGEPEKGVMDVAAAVAPFVACGDVDAFDSDMNYGPDTDTRDALTPFAPGRSLADGERQKKSLPPVQPPIAPPYKAALRLKRGT